MAKKKSTPRKEKSERLPSSPENDGLRAANMVLAQDDIAGRTLTVKTIIYVHGIDNKPPVEVLRCQWDHALFRQPMGDRTRMAYWVNRRRYPVALESQCDAPDRVMPQSNGGVAVRAFGLEEPSDADFIHRLDTDKAARDWLGKLNAALVQDEPQEGDGVSPLFVDSLIGAPMNLIFRLTRRAFLADVHDFFFDEAERRRMLESVRSRVRTGGGPFVVIGHSQGSMIAYEFLRTLARDQLEVPLLVTIGSPLGLPPVRDRFRRLTGKSKLPFPPCVTRWINVANRGDIVSLDTDLANDIDLQNLSAGQTFQNFVVNSPNADLRSDRHSATGYLKTDPVHIEVRRVVGNDFAQPVAHEVISRDLVEEAERVHSDQRVPALIELEIELTDGQTPTVEDLRNLVSNRILDLAGADNAAAVRIDHAKRFISAFLTAGELEQLRTEYAGLKIHRIWRDMEKRALINESRITIQAAAANLSYEAEGQNITWAVLDTGIDPVHPHFALHANVAAMWDCTQQGVQPIPAGLGNDVHGHGTHVSGIIAGDWSPPAGSPRFAGMAPRARLHSFKVLDNNGQGRDSFIIKALDKIVEINEDAGRIVIHGVNLSLGGGFDPSVYGCGHTPLCNELRRLWRQGVVVVIAAGNEGHEALRKASGGVRHANLDLSIGDPANLEEAIAVGAVHRNRPHSFGVSFFSSRGPTADGRLKPDVVAPGERILSARSGANGIAIPALYVQASGTSMAAPHVSGVLAAFLSIRREFIGNPDHLKELLIQHCTDLRRDRYLQGAGMPNLVRMLAST